MVDRLAGEPIVAVDTESNSLFAYRERVCLIQFSTPQEDILVDPLALDNLSPLGELFAEARIEKVFHAAEYDLITMKRDFGFSFANLFDTMLAARILGWPEVGLGPILNAEFDVQLDKGYQRANWGRRPLPADMLDYARLDTHYLIPLRMHQKAELKAQERWALAEEDFNRLRFVNGRDPDNHPEACWRVSGAYDLTAQQAAVLQALCEYRDQVARAIDRPVFKVINDRALLAIAAASAQDPDTLERASGLSPKQLQRHEIGLLKAVQRGLRAEPLYPPRSPRPDDRYLARLEALRNWRKLTAQGMGVSSDVVLPRDLLYGLAALESPKREAMAAILAQVPWRLKQFGEEILEVLANA
jgi:ribonuclease D